MLLALVLSSLFVPLCIKISWERFGAGCETDEFPGRPWLRNGIHKLDRDVEVCHNGSALFGVLESWKMGFLLLS